MNVTHKLFVHYHAMDMQEVRGDYESIVTIGNSLLQCHEVIGIKVVGIRNNDCNGDYDFGDMIIYDYEDLSYGN